MYDTEQKVIVLNWVVGPVAPDRGRGRGNSPKYLTGWVGLYAAIILQAEADVRTLNLHAGEAADWLASEVCELMALAIGLDYSVIRDWLAERVCYLGWQVNPNWR